MGKIISFANQKGGVAKTTSAHNIAIALSMKGKKTLMIDLDSQASLTVCAGKEPLEFETTNISSVLTDEKGLKRNIKDCIFQVGEGKYITENAFILPSIIDLARVEQRMYARTSKELILKRAIEPIRDEFDFIIIDCPPQLSTLTLNALSCSDGVIVPVKTDYLSYRGLDHLKTTISEVQELTNPELKLYGMLATFYVKRSKNDTAILMQLNRENKVLAVLNRRVWTGKGVYDGLAVVELNPNLDISLEYFSVADMIISNNFKGVGGIE